MLLALSALATNFGSLLIGLLTAALLGPAAFGQFAVAMLFAGVIQILAFDWIRLAATRFYAVEADKADGAWRTSFDLMFLSLAVLVASSAAIGFLWAPAGINIMPSVLAGVFALANGFYDYHMAMVRACFKDGLYIRLSVTKMALSIMMTLGATYMLHRYEAPLIGLISAPLCAVLLHWPLLKSPHPKIAHHSSGRMALILSSLRYSYPMVLAACLTLCIALLNRSFISFVHGYADTGFFSLPADVGSRIISALGLSFDALFFQWAVRSHSQYGLHHAQVQLQHNLTWLVALLAPASVGLWFIAPHIEQIFIAPEYYGAFTSHLIFMLPGFLCVSLAQYGFYPFFQIIHRTSLIIIATLLGVIGNCVLLIISGADATSLNVAFMQSAAYALMLCVLMMIARAEGALLPHAKDMLQIFIGIVLMCLILWPLRLYDHSPLILVAQILCGVTVYMGSLWVMSFHNLRPLWHAYWHKSSAQFIAD